MRAYVKSEHNNKSVVRSHGSSSKVILIHSLRRLLKVFKKYGINICYVAVPNCLENCLFHFKFNKDDVSVEASYSEYHEIQEPSGSLHRQTSK
jgi:hypothetical protein